MASRLTGTVGEKSRDIIVNKERTSCGEESKSMPEEECDHMLQDDEEEFFMAVNEIDSKVVTGQKSVLEATIKETLSTLPDVMKSPVNLKIVVVNEIRGNINL